MNKAKHNKRFEFVRFRSRDAAYKTRCAPQPSRYRCSIYFFGQVIAYGGGAAAVAYLLFQFLGKKWIEKMFAERLEQHRHEQALELQKLRVEIDALLSGAIKLQEKEFLVLPLAWEKLDEAHAQISGLVSPLQQYADVERMAPEQLEEFLNDTEFAEYQKKRYYKLSRKRQKISKNSILV